MDSYILRLFFWTEDAGEKDVELTGQYRIYATSEEVAWTVAATVLDHEPLLGLCTKEEVFQIDVDLEREEKPES